MWRIVTCLPIIEGTDWPPFTHAQARPYSNNSSVRYIAFRPLLRHPKPTWQRAADEARRWSNVGAIAAAAAWVGSWVAETCARCWGHSGIRVSGGRGGDRLGASSRPLRYRVLPAYKFAISRGRELYPLLTRLAPARAGGYVGDLLDTPLDDFVRRAGAALIGLLW